MSFSVGGSDDADESIPLLVKSLHEPFDFSQHTNYVQHQQHLPPNFKIVELQLRPSATSFGGPELGIVLVGPQNVKLTTIVPQKALKKIFSTIKALQSLQ